VGLGNLRGGGGGTYLIPAAAIPLGLPHHCWALPCVRLSIQEGGGRTEDGGGHLAASCLGCGG